MSRMSPVLAICTLALTIGGLPAAAPAAAPDCSGLSAGPAPAECAAVLPKLAPLAAPLLAPGSMATSPDALLSQCAHMNVTAPQNVTTVGSIAFRPACDFANNDFSKLYCLDFAAPATLSYVDYTTCAETVVGTANNTQNPSGLAWDSTTGTMYMSTTNISTSQLHTINLTTGASTLVGTITGSPGNIAIGVDWNGDLYGHDVVTDSLHAINKSSGAGTLIGPLSFDANFAQGMDFDHSDGTCYIFAFNNTLFQGELRTCNINTGATSLVGVIGSTTPGGLQEWTGPGILRPDVDPCFNAVPTSGCSVNGSPPGLCRGTSSSDVIIGTGGSDVIDGRGGADYLVGLQGHDLLCGRGGADLLIGNGGRDTLVGGGGPDRLEGLGGGDRLLGQRGNDVLVGGGGNDRLDGGAGNNDELEGGLGTDTCRNGEVVTGCEL